MPDLTPEQLDRARERQEEAGQRQREADEQAEVEKHAARRAAVVGAGRSILGMPSGSVWVVLVLGGAMLFLAIVKSGKLAEGQLIGVLAFLVAGTLYPPFGIILGALIVFGMFIRGGGTALFDWLGGIVQVPAGPSVASQPLEPPVQAVQIKQTQGVA